ncbi:hypothetical protein E1A91_A13G037400v1 [Gossypium mustelinum]|uniref:BHLH domain-containing protein n=2 Tax=Gossypium mustelinum TaxID=34275 RepID=A0A5D2WE37_GOSMU|nr:hypothetical protein E1A91_A13G037400v1 [Gossypium mustelinum]
MESPCSQGKYSRNLANHLCMSSLHLENLFSIPEATDEYLWPLIQVNKDDGKNFSASIQTDGHQCSSSSSQAVMDNLNGNKLDPVLDLDQGIPALLSADYTIEDNARTGDQLGTTSKFILESVDPNIVGESMESVLDYPIDVSLSAALEDSDDIDLVPHETSSRQHPSTNQETRDAHINAKRISSKTRGRNHRFKEGLNMEDNGEGTTMKKEEHNAKERIRRMKLHAAYLALGALLPSDSTGSKKRKSTALIIDRAVEYIPELEKEIQKLTLRKNDMLSIIKNKKSCAVLNHFQLRQPSVSVHEIKQGEFIVQICTQEYPDCSFLNLLHNIEEEEGICIISASTHQVSDHGHCYHLHIQMHERLDGENHIASLREKVISWLC